MFAMPKLESHKMPDDFTVVGQVPFAVQAGQLIEERRAEIATLPGAGVDQRVLNQLIEPGILEQPNGERDAKTVLFLVENLVREDIAHRLLEDESLLEALELKRRRNLAGELDEIVIHERIADLHTG